MTDPTIHSSIADATRTDFQPLYGDDDGSSLIPCIDIFFQSGIVELVHVPIVEPFLITPDYARFEARQLNPDRLREGLTIGGALKPAIVAVRDSALNDGGLIAACTTLSAQLEILIEDDDC